MGLANWTATILAHPDIAEYPCYQNFTALQEKTEVISFLESFHKQGLHVEGKLLG